MAADRRRFSAQDVKDISEIFQHTLADRASLKKNGHTWKEWFDKAFPVDRVITIFILIVVSAWTFGGDLRDAKAQLQTAADKADVASAKSEAAAVKAEIAAKTISQIENDLAVALRAIEAQRQQQETLSAQQATFRNQVNERLGQSVTRSEFRSVVNQQIMPQLQKIEQAQPK